MAASIREALRSNEIIPDVLDDFHPKFTLKITYPSTHTEVSLGNHISTSKIQNAPVYEFHPISPSEETTTESKKAYHLVLTDPDAKSRQHPIWSEFCHWIISNVSSPAVSGGPGSSGKSEAKVLEPYMGPSPPAGTGYHRYVFVLLRGDADKCGKLEAPKERKHWGYGKERHGVRQSASQHELEVVGANFFFAQHE
ncbi:carboxypeptidase Y inhibitor [Emydomyces testavorans]|uniref:Carboxypeptidase Y inhibitor n=1 Tax=Emydomyces testavorans TaxID=2070801 RepID=A0AAF0DHA3_9EURO|nr:carboxypeptidase Y inhibitor [Emydomyces testavorans]